MQNNNLINQFYNDSTQRKNQMHSEQHQMQELNFFLRSPKRGKIHRGPLWRAFDKQSLGTIPGKSEKIIFEDRSTKNNYAFCNATERFQEKSESEKYSFPGPGNYAVDLNEISKNHIKNPSFSCKGYGNGFLSKLERFDSLEEYYSKFSPGPGNYSSKKKTISDEVTNSNLYRNMYNTDKTKSKKAAEIFNVNNNLILVTDTSPSPGPGQYNSAASDFALSEKDKKENFFFLSKEKRKMPFESVATVSPGPGRYYLNALKDFDLVKDPEKTSFFFKENKNEENNFLHKNKSEKNIERIIYSPIVDKLKKENDYEKYKFICESLNLKVSKHSSPGPGEYNLNSDFGKLKFDYSYLNSPVINEKDLNKDKEKAKEMEQINVLKKVRKEAFMPYFSPFKNLKNSANFVFNSKLPLRDFVKVNPTPGPCYYQPVKVERKNSFNMNFKNKWV